MFLRIWIGLFIVFAIYTIHLYLTCDNKKLAIPDKAIASGRNTWQQKNCQGCHQIYGLGGYMGPDLTNTISKNGAKRTRTFIKYGTGKMPDLHLPDSEITNIIAFLSWVDKTGKSSVAKESVHWTGTYIIK